MDFTFRHVVTVLHGWCFGAVFLIGFPAALLALTGYRRAMERVWERERRWHPIRAG